MDTSITPAMRRTLSVMPVSTAWMTASEMPGTSPAALTIMARRDVPLVERRWTRWGGETGQKAGCGYEYRLTTEGVSRRGEALARAA